MRRNAKGALKESGYVSGRTRSGSVGRGLGAATLPLRPNGTAWYGVMHGEDYVAGVP